MTIEKIELQIAYGAVKHFGRNLYTSNPPAIAELIANSWDAYSTECDLFYLSESNESSQNSLLILDNGIGMTDNELMTRYAVSGTPKDNDAVRKPENILLRPYMGRKGIGKFSAFSLGDEYILYTKASSDNKWKKITFQYDLLFVNQATIPVGVEYVDNLEELNEIFDINITNSAGTAIYIPNLKRKIISSSIEGLKNLISRRFSVSILKEHNFTLRINNENIDLAQHFYDKNLEFIYYFGMDKDAVKARFTNIDEKYLYKVADIPFIESNNISGWIGTVETPSQLWADSTIGISGVVVYINGKLADEDILKDKLKVRVSNAYAIGEVNADFLENEEDPVLSSREGLNKELQNVVELTSALYTIRNKIDSTWSELRASRSEEKQDYLQGLLRIKEYSPIYDTFNSDQKSKFKKISQRIFDNLDTKEHSDSEYRTYAPIIYSLVNTEIIHEIQVSENDQLEEALIKLYNLMEKAEINSALRLKSNFEDRLTIINELEKCREEKAVESIFEKHLAKNPWLINQYWDKASDSLIISTQEKYSTLIAENKIQGRSDIIVRVADEPYPIICELKRELGTGYSAPNYREIISQISLYRNAISENISKDNRIPISNFQDIKAYFICGTRAYDRLSVLELNELKNNKIELLTYQKIIERAKSAYKVD